MSWQHGRAMIGTVRDGEVVGLLTYEIVGGELEVMTIDAYAQGVGVGSAFYQGRGLQVVRVDAGAVEAARALKPSIPLVGQHGIPIRDEIELELPLA